MNIFLVLERIIWFSIISYGEICFDIQVLWITSTFPERIKLANLGTIVYSNECSEGLSFDHLYV
jgi:hypothetical protein